MVYEVDWNDPALKRWLDSITKKTNKFNYKSAFRNYAEFTGMTATELIEEALKMYTDTESRKAAKFDRENRYFF